MNTASTSPILTSTTQHEAGADTAPSGIIVRSCTTIGGTTLIVQLAGEIDHFTAGPLRALLASAAADGYTDLALDTSRVTFWDSGFLNVLECWTGCGRRLRIESRSPAVERLLCAVTGLASSRLRQTGGDHVGLPSPVSSTRRTSLWWAFALSSAGMS